MRSSLVVLVLLALGSALSAKVKFSPLERRLIQMTDERRNADSLAMFLASNDEKVAWRAAWGIANIGDTTVRPQIIARLGKETRPTIVDVIAWALGTLGENSEAYEALAKVSAMKRSNDVLRALGRTVSKSQLASFKKLLHDLGNGPKAPAFGISLALIDVSLRKLMDAELVEIALTHTKSPDPEVVWRATYSLSRTEDSAALASHIGEVRELLNDLGSPEIRMFAALAVGRIHNDSAVKLLTNAARSEKDWRVRVNIFNALGRSLRMTSAISDVIRLAATEAVGTEPTTEHVANAALMTLDAMLAAGKVSSSDSVTIREWLKEFDPSYETHVGQSYALRGQGMALLTRFGGDAFSLLEAADHIASFRERTATLHAITAYSHVMDTLSFQRLMALLTYPDQVRLPFALEALQTHWKLAQKDKGYKRILEESGLANAYRHAVIRISGLVTDAAVVEVAMQSVQDSTIVADSSFRSEAEEYLLKYLDYFQGGATLDQLGSTLSAMKWLKPRSEAARTKVKSIHAWAADAGYGAIADSAFTVLEAFGEKPIKLQVAIRRSPIDWNMLENSPDTLLVQNPIDFLFIKLYKYEAPLTCLNMLNLAANSYFATEYVHRVVPNFVIQSGDPTGTGSGGPGYAIRREISPLAYDKPGVVGMASSGKDTEGSQWFATHLPTPHLDTRYTIWGHVMNGLSSVERFRRNDKLDNIIPFSMQ
jgi:peptidylprolyl isomerase